MKILAIETYPVRIPLKSEFRMVSALGRHEVSEFLLVRLVTDVGIEGAGEASVTAIWSGETAWGGQAMVERVLAPALLGLDVEQLDEIDHRMERLTYGNWFVRAAIEMACWDALGKQAGKPVYDLLGGPRRPLRIRGRFSMGAYDPQRAADRARELVAWGFDTIKVKVGGRPEDDIARVRAVREAVGPAISLVIDANCGWDAQTAIDCVQALADCDLALVEQPTPDGDFAGMARVRRETGKKIMADDICFDLADAKELARGECCDVISVYPGKNAGIRRSMAIAELAAQHGIACTIGSNLEWDIATAAMGHLCVAAPNVQVELYPGDIYGPVYHEQRIVTNPIEFDGPTTTVPSGPGLGVEVDWDLVRTLRAD